MSVIKTVRNRLALRKAATSDESCGSLGTDSAPHPVIKKLTLNGIPGIFNAPVCMAIYNQVFEEERALDKRLTCQSTRFRGSGSSPGRPKGGFRRAETASQPVFWLKHDSPLRKWAFALKDHARHGSIWG